jgi:altronate hydrolase
VDVVQYAEEVRACGFVFMDSPGYEPVSATGQVAGGANLVCFTTGRGSVFGCKPAPSIKLATNSTMFRHIVDDMDVNCGTILDGDDSVQGCGERIFELILRVASGEATKSEAFDFGAAEFAPWVLGAQCNGRASGFVADRAQTGLAFSGALRHSPRLKQSSGQPRDKDNGTA